MKLRRRPATFIVILAIANLGLFGLALRQFTAPPPAGEAYQLVSGWPRSAGAEPLGQVAGVGVDESGRVFVFRRAERIWRGEPLELEPIAAPTVMVFDGRTGELLSTWGEKLFVMPHGLTVDPVGNVWLTDVGLHQVFKFDPTGKLLLALGTPGVPGQDGNHFSLPTDVAVAPDGSFYVSDGYGNSRIAKFSPEGRFLFEWGTPGTGPGQFDVPHGLALDPAGRLYVADRGNARVQVFDGAGRYLAEWKGRALGRPWAVRVGPEGAVYVVDGGDQPVLLPDRARILKLDQRGNVLAAFGSHGDGPGQFVWPHAIAVAPDGSLYVGEVATGMRVQKFQPDSAPGGN